VAEYMLDDLKNGPVELREGDLLGACSPGELYEKMRSRAEIDAEDEAARVVFLGDDDDQLLPWVRQEVSGPTLATATGRRHWRRWLYEGGQWAATGIAIGGVLLNNARIRWCFPLWLVSNTISLGYHVRGRLWGLAVRDLVFSVLAIVGWFMWAAAGGRP